MHHRQFFWDRERTLISSLNIVKELMFVYERHDVNSEHSPYRPNTVTTGVGTAKGDLLPQNFYVTLKGLPFLLRLKFCRL